MLSFQYRSPVSPSMLLLADTELDLGLPTNAGTSVPGHVISDIAKCAALSVRCSRCSPALPCHAVYSIHSVFSVYTVNSIDCCLPILPVLTDILL